MTRPPLVLLCWVSALMVGCASQAPAFGARPLEEPAAGPAFAVSVKTVKPSPATSVTLTHLGYGYSEKDPIKVGGGPEGEHQYLALLRGPQGQPIRYFRKGSCCAFETRNGPLGSGLLDMYEVTYDGLETPVVLYLDMYDREEPRAPDGFRLD